MKHLSEEQVTLVYFGEAGAVELEHIAGCADCRGEYARLAAFLDALKADALRQAPMAEPAANYEQRLWAGLSGPVRERLTRRRNPALRYWWLAPAMAGVAAVAFFMGMYTRDRMRPISSNGRERVLLIALGDHLDRSQIVLAELENAPEGKTADISAERQLAQGLVSENRLLRQTAARQGDTEDASVLDELERVLVDVAHAPSEVSAQEIDGLRRRIEAQGLLFKVRIIGSNAREKGMKL